MTAEDNLEFYGRVWRITAEERRARIRELLDNINLWDRRREIVRDWSRGMRQKLAIARALLHHPKLIFMGEPTARLDPVAAAALREDLKTLVEQQGTTVFLTTHNLAEAERLCNKLAVIHEGKLLAIGSPDELGRKQGSRRLVVTGSEFSEEEELVQACGHSQKLLKCAWERVASLLISKRISAPHPWCKCSSAQVWKSMRSARREPALRKCS